MPSLLPRRKSSRRDYYTDSSDDEAYYSLDRRPRGRSPSPSRYDRRRGDRDRVSEKSYSGRPYSDRRRARSLDSDRRSRNHHHRGRSERSHRDSDRDRSRRAKSMSRNDSKIEHTVNAAIDAAALEAYRLRREPGAWTGKKGARVATAAIGAAVVDRALGGRKESHSKRTLAKSTIGGLIANRLVNGKRDDLRYH